MSKEYKIQYLDDKKFEMLSVVNPRYQNTKDDLGFADMVTNKIFVRKTGNRLADLFITQHELEHLLDINKNHEDEYNIRHKKGRDIIGTIAPIVTAFIPGIGPALAATMSAGYTGYKVSKGEAKPWQIPVNAGLTYVGGKIAQGGAGYQQAVADSAKMGGGVVGKTLSGIQGTLGIQSGASKTLENSAKLGMTTATIPETMGGAPGVGTVISKVPGAAANATLPSGVNALKAATTAIPLVASSISSPVNMNWSQPGATTQNLGFQTPVTGAYPSGVSTPASNINWSATTPKVETQAALPQGMQNVGTGVTDKLGEEATKQTAKKTIWDTLGLKKEDIVRTALGASIPLAGSMFTKTPEPFTPEQSQLFNETAQMVRSGAQVQLTPAQSQAITAQYDTALEQARQNIMDRYKMLRPGSDIATDSNMREALTELETDFAEKKANALASAQLGLSAQQTQMMGELAQMEIYTLAQKAGISYQEAKDFKDMLSQIGFVVAKSGQPTGGRVIQISY